jgi:hypothetical protein
MCALLSQIIAGKYSIKRIWKNQAEGCCVLRRGNSPHPSHNGGKLVYSQLDFVQDLPGLCNSRDQLTAACPAEGPLTTLHCHIWAPVGLGMFCFIRF